MRKDPTNEDIKRVKGLGCLRDKRYPDVFNVRVITVNGKMTAEKHIAVAQASLLYGSGEVAMTTRLTLEIQGVKYENIEALREYLAKHGLTTGGTGAKVRPVVSCKGTTCVFGLCDTFSLSEKIHKRFYEGYHHVSLPHKFKIAVGGCPNNCVKPDLNDIGIIGQRIPAFDTEKCRACKVCAVEKACPVGGTALADGVIARTPECNNCGRCASSCPFGVTESYTYAYKMFLGGRWGKKAARGTPLTRLFYSEEEVLETVEKVILFYRSEGLPGERFADTLARLGMEYITKALSDDGLLKRKEEILK